MSVKCISCRIKGVQKSVTSLQTDLLTDLPTDKVIHRGAQLYNLGKNEL